jgi:hypothetical protein
MKRLDAVIRRIDQLNAADPNLEMNEGRSEPRGIALWPKNVGHSG